MKRESRRVACGVRRGLAAGWVAWAFVAGCMAARAAAAEPPASTTPSSPTQPRAPQYDPAQVLAELPPATYAVFETDHGVFVALLYTEQAPRTTANFIGLAEGVREFRDPATGERVKRPYYDGQIFHRVIRNGLIQTGDPTGRGNGGTGYYFEDEFNEALKHDQIGVLSMATQGPGTHTNDGQFAIALRLRPDLDMKYSVFGRVVKGIEVAQAIGAVPTVETPAGARGPSQRPAPPEPRILTLRIYRVEPGGSITPSPPPPDVDIRMRWAPPRGDRGPSRAGSSAAATTGTTITRGQGRRGGNE